MFWCLKASRKDKWSTITENNKVHYRPKESYLILTTILKYFTVDKIFVKSHIFKMKRLPRKPPYVSMYSTLGSDHGLFACSWMDGTEMLSGLREDVCGVGVEGLCSFSVLMQLTARKAECWLCRFKPATDGYGTEYWPHGLIKKITSGTSRRGQR